MINKIPPNPPRGRGGMRREKRQEQEQSDALDNQAIVDEAGSVMQVSDGYLGSCHDKSIFEAEQAAEAEFDRELQIIAHLIEQEVPVLGDKAYLASETVIIPHKRNTKVYRELPELCKAYNKHHGRKREVVENAFARIKQFRVLQGLYRDKISTVGRTFKAIVNVIELQKKVAQFATVQCHLCP